VTEVEEIILKNFKYKYITKGEGYYFHELLQQIEGKERDYGNCPSFYYFVQEQTWGVISDQVTRPIAYTLEAYLINLMKK